MLCVWHRFPQIWKLANPQKKPGLSENDFTVALRLIAIAQKGYPVNPKSLQTIQGE